MPGTVTLQSFIDELKNKRDTIPFVPNMEEDDLAVAEGDILPITAEVYDFRLDLLPPRWIERSAFAYAEGGNPVHYFWQDGPNEFYVLLMTDAETDAFYHLSGHRRWQ